MASLTAWAAARVAEEILPRKMLTRDSDGHPALRRETRREIAEFLLWHRERQTRYADWETQARRRLLWIASHHPEWPRRMRRRDDARERPQETRTASSRPGGFITRQDFHEGGTRK